MPELLAQHAVLRKPFSQHRPHRLLGATVGDRHRALIGLQLGTQPGAKERPDHSPRHVSRRFGTGNQTIERVLGHHSTARRQVFFGAPAAGAAGAGAAPPAGAAPEAGAAGAAPEAGAAGAASSGFGNGTGLAASVRK